MTSTGGMNLIQRKVLDKFYARAAGAPERLPWHRATPDQLLTQVVESGSRRGRALDVGCGSGVFSVYLARQGYEVTAIDMHPGAVAMARRAAEGLGGRMKVVQADVLEFSPEERFDLVYDSGCLHCMSGAALKTYRAQVLSWLAPKGDFVLGHFDKRHALDWRPMGPRRRTPVQIESLFAPELRLRDRKTEEMAVPLPIGPIVRGTSYWFQRIG